MLLIYAAIYHRIYFFKTETYISNSKVLLEQLSDVLKNIIY